MREGRTHGCCQDPGCAIRNANLTQHEGRTWTRARTPGKRRGQRWWWRRWCTPAPRNEPVLYSFTRARGVSYLAKETRVLEMDGWVSSVARPSGWQPAKQPASPRTWLQPRTGDNSWRGALLLIWSLLVAGQSSIAPPPPPPLFHPLGSSSRAGEERGDCHHTKWVGFTHGPRLNGPEAEQRRETEGRRGSAFTNTRTLASRSSGEEATGSA